MVIKILKSSFVYFFKYSYSNYNIANMYLNISDCMQSTLLILVWHRQKKRFTYQLIACLMFIDPNILEGGMK